MKKQPHAGLAFIIGSTLVALVMTIVIAASALASSSKLDSSPELIPPAPAAPAVFISSGTVKRLSVDVNGQQRSFLLSVPAGYSPEQPWPVLMVFHGLGDTGKAIHRGSTFDKSAALVIYGRGIGEAWAPAPYARSTVEEDLAYVDKVLETVSEQYVVDPQRVYAAGISNGGGAVSAYSCHRPDLFAGVATVSSAVYEGYVELCPEPPIPFMTIHGTADQVIHYAGGMRHEVPYYSSPEFIDYLRERNKCSGPPAAYPESTTTVKYTYLNCAAPIVHVRIDGGAHVWFGGEGDQSPGVVEGYSTYRILEFFNIPWQQIEPIAPPPIP